MGGRPKGLIEIEGKPILSRLVELLAPRCRELFAVSDPNGPYRESGLRLISDIHPGKGAPGGVHTALANAECPWVLILACDLPFMDAQTLDALQPSPDHDAVLYRAGGREQPLAGLWNKRCAGHIEKALANGNPSLAQLTRELDIKWIDVENSRPFFNLNSPEDLSDLDRLS
jgi:molybdopterin-guanine dinucleotide biosynthesis protein A